MSDITSLRTSGGWVYLTTVIDLFDQRVISWALSADMETGHTTTAALEMAFKNRTAQAGLLFHSDQGVQYCAKAFRSRLGELCPAVRQSLSRKGTCWDNACAERFFKTLKTERETLDGRHSAAEVRQSVFMYIEAYYNRLNALYFMGEVYPLIAYPLRILENAERFLKSAPPQAREAAPPTRRGRPNRNRRGCLHEGGAKKFGLDPLFWPPNLVDRPRVQPKKPPANSQQRQGQA